MDSSKLAEITAYYRSQGAPQDQQMLIALLREVQQAQDGLLTPDVLEAVAQAYAIRRTLLEAMIRRVPDLRSTDAPHTLEVCGTCRAGAQLRSRIEQTYGVKSGAVSKAGFLYRVTPCMKNCKSGPSIRWDGRLYSHADEALVRNLIEGELR